MIFRRSIHADLTVTKEQGVRILRENIQEHLPGQQETGSLIVSSCRVPPDALNTGHSGQWRESSP
jgi:hypothetical protein